MPKGIRSCSPRAAGLPPLPDPGRGPDGRLRLHRGRRDPHRRHSGLDYLSPLGYELIVISSRICRTTLLACPESCFKVVELPSRDYLL